MQNLRKLVEDKSNWFFYRGYFNGKLFVKYKGKPVSLEEANRRFEQSEHAHINTVNISYRTHDTKTTRYNYAMPEQLYAAWLFMEYCRVKLWVRK